MHVMNDKSSRPWVEVCRNFSLGKLMDLSRLVSLLIFYPTMPFLSLISVKVVSDSVNN